MVRLTRRCVKKSFLIRGSCKEPLKLRRKLAGYLSISPSFHVWLQANSDLRWKSAVPAQSKISILLAG